MFEIGNYIEAAFWYTVGIVMGVRAFQSRSPRRKRAIEASLVFLVFGTSDVVEVETGAWWDPWWLLMWKGACVIALAALWIDYRKTTR
jgi:hypothetical protein